MPVFVEVIFVSLVMILSFFGVFLIVFLIALMLQPVEKSLSKAVWDMRAASQPPPKDTGGFKGFSQKYR